ncbi:MAG: hypothetical protein GC181_00815 [Bacteroidetes bacterium]|nr:hypothetical protein [Bacteroidota bacterium]
MKDLAVITQSLVDYLKALYPKAENIEVDELEFTENRKACFITLSFQSAPNTPSELLSNKRETRFKVFEVEMKSGEVISMKNKETEW